MSEARLLALYLLSFHALAHALLAWDPRAVASPLLLAAWAWTLAVALVAGEWLGPRLAATGEWLGRKRVKALFSMLYLALAVLGPPLALAGPRLVVQEVALFGSLQPLLLLLSWFDHGVLGSLANALVLVVLASLRGGVVAGVAVTGFLPLLGVFLALDHYARTLGLYPAGRVPALGVVFRRAAGIVAWPMAVMAGFFAAAPPTPFVPASLGAQPPVVEDVAAAYRALAALGFLGALGIMLVARLLRRFRRREAPTAEWTDAERMSEEAVPLPQARRAPAYPGRRGRIVRAYLSFLAHASRMVVRHRPSQTPREFAALVRQPAGPLGVLTELFVRARYGPGEPGEDEAQAAERAAEAVVAALRRPRPSG